MANTIAASVTLNAVLPNCPPHERPIDAASKPSSRNTEMMPAAYQTLSMNACGAAVAALVGRSSSP